jgi:uncharacterized protein involved in exopolysaccharide biosynthesis
VEKALDEVKKEGYLKNSDFESIKKKINTGYLHESNVLQVTVYLHSPAVALKLSNAIIDSFFAYQTKSRTELADKMLAVVKEQTISLGIRLNELKTQLKELSDKEKLSFYQQQIPFYMNTIQDIDRRNLSIDAGIERIREELKIANSGAGRRDLKSFFPIMSNISVMPNVYSENNTQLPTSYLAGIPWLQDMKKRVTESQMELTQLLSQYTENYPDVAVVREKIGALQNDLNNEIKNVLENYNEYYNAYTDYLQQQKKLNESERARYHSELDSLSSDMDAASAKQIEYFTLMRNYEAVQDVFAMFMRKQSELQFVRDETARVGMPNVKILEYASLPKKPFSPNFVLNVLLGMAFGCMIGTIGCILEERKSW